MTETPQIPAAIIDRLGLVPAEPDKQAYYGQYMPEGVEIYQKGRFLYSPVDFNTGRPTRIPGGVAVVHTITKKQLFVSSQFLICADDSYLSHVLSPLEAPD